MTMQREPDRLDALIKANGHAPGRPLPFDLRQAAYPSEEMAMVTANAVAAVARKITLRGCLIVLAALLLAALAAANGVVSWHGQYGFIYAIKHQHLSAALEALGPDCGAVIFAVLGVALALAGRRAITERILVCAMSALSVVMNLGAADLGSPRAIGVYVLPPVLFAVTTDRLIAVIRRSAIGERDRERSPWALLARLPLYPVRLALAPAETWRGLRQSVLDATPLPKPPAPPKPRQAPHPAVPARTTRPGGARPGKASKARQLIGMAADRADLAALSLPEASRLAAQIAPLLSYSTKTARVVLRAHVAQLQREVTP